MFEFPTSNLYVCIYIYGYVGVGVWRDITQVVESQTETNVGNEMESGAI